jgi:hypothetical protein
MGPSGAASCSAAGAESSSGNVDKGWGKRGLFACRYIPKDSLTGFITPVRRKLKGSAGVGSSDLFATRLDDLCGQLHVVYPGRYNYSCSSVPASLYLWRVRLK